MGRAEARAERMLVLMQEWGVGTHALCVFAWSRLQCVMTFFTSTCLPSTPCCLHAVTLSDLGRSSTTSPSEMTLTPPRGKLLCHFPMYSQSTPIRLHLLSCVSPSNNRHPPFCIFLASKAMPTPYTSALLPFPFLPTRLYLHTESRTCVN